MKNLIFTGRLETLSAKLKSEVKRLLEEKSERDVFVVVPNQLTLETEIELMNTLGLNGSVRLNIVSPGRFCGRIFEESGRKNAVSVDERGKAMLMGYLLRKHSGKLDYYKKSYTKTGFENKLVEAITHFKQAGISVEALNKCIEIEEGSALGKKLSDLAYLYERYEEMLSGHMTDGEDEVSEALERMNGAEMLKNAYVLFYGFDITTNYINRLAAGTACNCLGVSVFLPIPSDNDIRDISIYLPMQAALERLKTVFDSYQASYARIQLDNGERELTSVERAARELYCVPTKQVKDETEDVCVVSLKNPLEEAFYVAGRIRSLVRKNGWHYSDIRILLEDTSSYEDILRTAFDSMQIPYFTQDMRDALKHPLCMFLSETFDLILGKADSATAIMETGFTALEQTEAEELCAYIRAMRLRPSSMLKPFTRGSDKAIQTAEAVRVKLAAPILALKTAIKEADSLREQLNAVYNYLNDMNCFEKSADYRSRMLELRLVSYAADDIRVGNMILGIFDQMLELFGDKPLSMTVLFDLIRRAMGSVIIKTLPQSPDAVQVASPQRTGLTPVKAVFMMNAVSEGIKAGGDALDESEISALTEITGKYIRPDEVALARTNRMYVKNAFTLAKDFLCVTHATGGMDGKAVTGGAIINELKHAAPNLKTYGGVERDEHIVKMLLSSPESARRYLATHFDSIDEHISEITALKAVNEGGDLPLITKARGYRLQSEKLTRPIAGMLYANKTSVTKLEKYANCPFSHFISCGLKPAEEEICEISSIVKGNFYHKCVERFAKAAKKSMPATEDKAEALMNEISLKASIEDFADIIRENPIMEAQAESLRRIIARAGRLMQRQMISGVFRPLVTEYKIKNDDNLKMELEDGTCIEMVAKTDRIDMGSVNGKEHVLVVDYKSGNNQLDPSRIYEGLQLQLLMYLSAASSDFRADDAGAYYFHIQDQVVKIESTDEVKIELQRRKNEKLKGLAPADVDVLKAIAEDPNDILGNTLNKDQTLSKKATAATKEQFANLKAHTIRKAREFTRAVFDGNTDIAPVEDKYLNACRYCTYAAICLKDKKIKRKAGKRRLAKMDYAKLFELVEGEGGANEKHSAQ